MKDDIPAHRVQVEPPVPATTTYTPLPEPLKEKETSKKALVPTDIAKEEAL